MRTHHLAAIDLGASSGRGIIGKLENGKLTLKGNVSNEMDRNLAGILANGVLSTVHMSPFPKDEEMTTRWMTNPKSVGNITDAGAHGQMLCGGGENVELITKYVMQDKRISLEQAIHILTGKLMNFFGLTDRGELKVGKRADLTVFKDHVDRLAMVVNIEPVTDIESLAVNGELFVGKSL